MAKPKLALIPATQGSKLYSVLPADGVGDFNFSRNTVATRINKDGLIETVAVGKSRLNYPLIDGKVVGCPHHILEPQRTNLLTYSEAFDNAYWNKTDTTVTSSEEISPDGTLNASKLIEGTSNSRQEVLKNIVTSSSTNVVSCFIKKGTRRFASITTSDTTNWNTMVVVDLELGIVTKTYNKSGFSTIDKIENYGNGWYRLTSSITGVFIGNVLYARINIQNSGTPSNPPSNSYTGDGTSYIYIYGAQLEQGSYPTSYIPTNGSAVTRSAETANGAGDASTFNDSEGVLMAEISALEGASTLIYRFITLSDGTASNKISIFFNQNGSLTWQLIGGLTVISRALSVAITNNNKIAIRYNSTSAELYVNGILADTALNGMTFSGLSTLQFRNNDGAYNFYGNTKQIQYFDSALTDSDLEKITSWTSFTDLANGQTYSIK